MLLSATPLNNAPMICRISCCCSRTAKAVPLTVFLTLKDSSLSHILDYKRLMRERDQRDVTADVDKIYEQIRSKVLTR